MEDVCIEKNNEKSSLEILQEDFDEARKIAKEPKIRTPPKAKGANLDNMIKATYGMQVDSEDEKENKTLESIYSHVLITIG